jgi:DNA-directed RNA polymerase sigma subunit (sigma70/sigma32)
MLRKYQHQNQRHHSPWDAEEHEMKKLDQYVGRIVRLNKQAFQELKNRAKHQGHVLENCFLVTEVNRGMQKLICYGANLRIVVSVADVILV